MEADLGIAYHDLEQHIYATIATSDPESEVDLGKVEGTYNTDLNSYMKWEGSSMKPVKAYFAVPKDFKESFETMKKKSFTEWLSEGVTTVVDGITNTARGVLDIFTSSGGGKEVFEAEYITKPALKPDDAVKQDVYEQYVEMLIANGISAKEAEQAVADAILNNEFEATKAKEVAVAAAIPMIYEGVAFISAAILSKAVGDELAKKYSGLGGDFKDSLEEINSDISEKETSEYYKKQYEKSKSSAIKSKVTTAASSGGMPDPDDDWDPRNGKDDRERFEWEVKDPKDSDEVVRHQRFGKFYKDPSQQLGNKDIWWTKDTANHGGSRYKLYVKEGRDFKHFADIAEDGKQILKHKGDVGDKIPLKQFIKVK